MEFHAHHLYHVYNRGNNQQPIFFSEANYLFFLLKIRTFILPHCDVLCYALMPNHFHLLIYTDERSNEKKLIGTTERNVVSEGVRNMLQTYTKAINKQNSTTGSLFQQNTKAKCLDEGSVNYGITCFHYIHQNPMKAKLSLKMEDWDYSSFKDYTGLRNGTLCNKQLAFSLLGLEKNTFYNDSYKIINEDAVNFMF
ncbi:MAG: transposase [Chitinophagaceae bacterium]|nr:transposase [Chitinophagaceae bacterium]